MLYKNRNKAITTEEFSNPTSEYRGTPFWAWNCELEKDELLRQIDVFKEMGMGGFHMHARTGLSTPYLGEDFISMVKACNEKAKKDDMLCWLYDEDRWPSGSCGGLVTKDMTLALRSLLLINKKKEGYANDSNDYYTSPEKFLGYYLTSYNVILDDEGCLSSYAKDMNGTHHLYIHIGKPSPVFNNSYYIDTLNPKATERFIELTHEVYKKAVGDDFGKSIPAIFSDEPKMVRFVGLNFPDDEVM